MNIVLDLETTGFLPDRDEILQISLINADTNETLLNEYVRPEHHTSWPEAMNVNHITPEMVKDAKTIDELMPEANRILKDVDTLVGYNTSFDVGFMEAYGAIFPEGYEMADVMKDFAVIYGEFKVSTMDFKWKKLGVCADYFGYDWGTGSAHDSLEDCRATAYCWRELMKPEWQLVYQENMERLSEIQQEYAPQVENGYEVHPIEYVKEAEKKDEAEL